MGRESSEASVFADFGVLGLFVNEGSLKRPLREPAEPGERAALGGDMMRLGAFEGVGEGLRVLLAYCADKGVTGWEGKESGERDWLRDASEGLAR